MDLTGPAAEPYPLTLQTAGAGESPAVEWRNVPVGLSCRRHGDPSGRAVAAIERGTPARRLAARHPTQLAPSDWWAVAIDLPAAAVVGRRSPACPPRLRSCRPSVVEPGTTRYVRRRKRRVGRGRSRARRRRRQRRFHSVGDRVDPALETWISESWPNLPGCSTPSLWGLTRASQSSFPSPQVATWSWCLPCSGAMRPDLATSAVLHLGTLAAVLVYFRAEVGQVLRLTNEGKQLLRLLIIGTIPAAVIGFSLRERLRDPQRNPTGVAITLIILGVGLYATRWIKAGERTGRRFSTRDAAALGFGQALALIPGISRSGSNNRHRHGKRLRAGAGGPLLVPARDPAIAGAGLLEFVDLASEGGGITAATWVGMGVAAVSGYAAIALLLQTHWPGGPCPFRHLLRRVRDSCPVSRLKPA